jgi:hypothetical protein
MVAFGWQVVAHGLGGGLVVMAVVFWLATEG